MGKLKFFKLHILYCKNDDFEEMFLNIKSVYLCSLLIPGNFARNRFPNATVYRRFRI